MTFWLKKMFTYLIYFWFLFILFTIITNIVALNVSNSNHWDVSEWWALNEDSDQNHTNLEFDISRKRTLDLKTNRSTADLYYTSSDFDLLESEESKNDKKLVIPKSSTQSIRDSIYNYFSRIRSYRGDKTYYRKIKRLLKEKFLNLGLTTATQSFWPQELVT